MAVSVRSFGLAMVATVVLTAAGTPPQPGSGSDDAAPADGQSAPAYFVLQDRPEPTIENAAVSDLPVRAPHAEAASPTETSLVAEARCLAAAVYYESRGEPLAGQLAVAHVILNRVHSGRFAGSVCGVVRQPGQFSFRQRSFAPAASADWRKASAVAQAALAGEGRRTFAGAMYFHANYVAPAWGRTELATIGRHVFYR